MSHSIKYTADELTAIAESSGKVPEMHRLKRYMYRIYHEKNLPGEIFRKYPGDIKFARYDFRTFLQSEERGAYEIEASNYGRIRINGTIARQHEEKKGWLVVRITNRIKYPVYRLVAETWCDCFMDDSFGWQVLHVTGDGYDNSPDNLMWIRDGDRKVSASIPSVPDPDVETDALIEKLNLVC
jgi:hypothetical protein